MATNDQLHESTADITQETREMHRALASLIEELEAVDWYAQRVDATKDPALKAVLAHNRDEEKEHACMTLEWVRRNDPTFDAHLRRFLFTEGSIAQSESAAETPSAVTSRTGAREAKGPIDVSLRIGSLRADTGNGQEGRT